MMGKSAHTQGPFSIQRRERHNDHVWHIVAPGDHINAVVCNTSFWNNSRNFEESRANARLLALSPDMHDLLKELRNAMSVLLTVEDYELYTGKLILLLAKIDGKYDLEGRR